MSDRKKALVLINKSAGTGKAGTDTLNIVARLAEEEYEPIVYPIIPGTELTSEKIIGDYDGEVSMILCSGGDGTLNHVMNAIMDLKEKPVLSYIPAALSTVASRNLFPISCIPTGRLFSAIPAGREADG